MAFHLREAREADIPALARLHVQTFNETHRAGRPGGPSYELRERQWREAFERQDGSWFSFVIEDEAGELVGFAKGTPHDGGVPGYAGELDKIYVLRRVQRQGLGRRLLNAVARRFMERGMTSMLLFGDAANPSNGFYEAFGAQRLYSPTGEFHGGYGWPELGTLTQRPVLIVPGWGNSGPQHWQTLWERAHPEYRRIEQRDWEMPDRSEWIATLDAAIRAAPSPPILVAHSLGCIAIAHWAADRGKDAAACVSAALLVAPPDIEAAAAPEAIHGFRPVPLEPLPFPSVVVGSRTDPWASFERAAEFARAWRSALVDAGDAGHVNTDAGYGPWPAGEGLLRDLQVRVV